MVKVGCHGGGLVCSLGAQCLATCVMSAPGAAASGGEAAVDHRRGPSLKGPPSVAAFDQHGRPLGRGDETWDGYGGELTSETKDVQSLFLTGPGGTLDAYWLDAEASRWLVIRSSAHGAEAALVCRSTAERPPQWVLLDQDWGDPDPGGDGGDPPVFLFDVNCDGTSEVFLSTTWRGARPAAWVSTVRVLMFDDDGMTRHTGPLALHEWSLADFDHDGVFEFEAVEHATVDVPSLRMRAEVVATRILAFQNGRLADTRCLYARQSYRRFVFGEPAGERRLGDTLPVIELQPFTTNFANAELEQAGGFDVHPPDLATISSGLEALPASVQPKVDDID